MAALMLTIGTMSQAQQKSLNFNLYGNTGLIDIPSGQVQRDGQISWNLGYFNGTQRGAINFQILPRLSGTVRYSSVEDLGGPGEDADDRAFDLHLQILKENGWVPDVAVGILDLTGTSPYSAEYIAATKTITPNIKVTAGLGWGRYGTNNGFTLFGSEDRETDAEPGQLQLETFFRGDVAPFAGIEWQTPIDKLSVLAEYSSDSYDAEDATDQFDYNSPFNFGLSYRPWDNVHLKAMYLYGSQIGVQVTLTGNPLNPLSPQDLGAGPLPINKRSAALRNTTNWANSTDNREKLRVALAEVLGADGISIDQIDVRGKSVDIFIRNGRIRREPKAIGRTARALAVAMPPSVEVFRITPVSNGMSTTTVEIKRSDLEDLVDTPDAALESWERAVLTDAAVSLNSDTAWQRPIGRRFSWSLNPTIPFSIFDPNEPIEPDIAFNLGASYRLTKKLTVSTSIRQWLIGTDQRTEDTSTSPLPHVRSTSGVYFSGRSPTLNRLTADYVTKITPTTYGRVSVGLLERIFAGVSTEILWAPTKQDWALGGELNYAKQRDFVSAFGLQDYDVVTGHASLYWDTGYYGLETQVDVGRYLAGDWGATFSLARRFTNGWEVSAYVTRTNVSVEDFGQGSYAKGVSLTMPLRWGLPYETKSQASINLGSVSSDGGARLRVSGRLYDRVRDLNALSLEEDWSTFWQ